DTLEDGPAGLKQGSSDSAVAKIGDKFRVLDLTEPGTRAAVATATTIKALYESDAAADYLA
ncbi:hypothetical protein, partial [Tabrizicola sp.]|uniref:hypothetical protein n=1 Tax=Tabrizicola sp. TaxID=2005166 RepID=UPI0026179A82